MGSIGHLKTIIELDPSHSGARMGLESLLSHDTVQADVAIILEPVYQSLSLWADLAEVLSLRIADQDGSEESVELRERLGRLLVEELGRGEDAMSVYGALLEGAPENQAYLDTLSELAENTGQWAELTKILERVVAEVDGADDRIRLLRIAGQNYETHQSLPAMAVDAYRRIIEDEPNDAAALEALERLYFATEQWTDLLEIIGFSSILRRQPTVSISAQMAQLLEEFLSDPHAAIDPI